MFILKLMRKTIIFSFIASIALISLVLMMLLFFSHSDEQKNSLKKILPTQYVSSTNFAIESDIFPYGFPQNYTLFFKDWFENKKQMKLIKALRVSYHKHTFHESMFSHIEDGDIIWLYSKDLKYFFDHVLTKLDKKVIIVCCGDPTFPAGYLFSPEEIDLHLLNENLLHLFVQNNNYQGKYRSKVTSIPIGMDYHTRFLAPFVVKEIVPKTPLKQEEILKQIVQQSGDIQKRDPDHVFCDFAINNNGGEKYGSSRHQIACLLKDNKIAEVPSRYMKRENLWRIKGEKVFDISPPGRGFDCYRTWESLILGCIVITKTSFLDVLFEGLPVITVEDWNDITPENLTKWRKEYGKFFNHSEANERLTHKYWMSKIQRLQQDYREKCHVSKP